MEKLVGLFEQPQRQCATAAETLQVFYGEFGQGQHMVCYDALRRGGLLPRLMVARSSGADARDDVLVKHRLALTPQRAARLLEHLLPTGGAADCER